MSENLFDFGEGPVPAQGRRAMNNDHCETLALRFRRMAKEEGLIDVRFSLRNLDEALKSQVCAEVEAVYAAIEAGDFCPLSFRDSYGGA